MPQRLIRMPQPRVDLSRFFTAPQRVLIGAHRPAIAPLGRQAESQTGISRSLFRTRLYQSTVALGRFFVSPPCRIEPGQRESSLVHCRIARQSLCL